LALQTAPLIEGEELRSPVDVPNQFATVRTNPLTKELDVLGVVGTKYHPIQNEDHAELLNTLVDESGAHFETAGSMKGGAEVFITMKLPETMNIGGMDPVDTYIAAINSHDGRSSFRFVVTPIRVVCANTAAAAIKGAKASFTVRHTRGGTAALQQAREALGITFNYSAEFEAAAERMIQETLTEAKFREIVDTIWVPQEKAPKQAKQMAADRADELTRLFLESDTNTEIRGTRWAGYNAFTEYVDHFVPVRGQHGEAAKDVRALRTLTSATAKEVKEEAFELLAV
ncbi:DUF932 domain-containing protein, partial [Arthrobacter sulfonylureivorans]|uniref:DUF932 domain-containing protein n=1 Tax=Arthrobacter sulfonylureivorans TaxID=2486855 RepID=UPI0039E2CAA6